ncbi:hypothetical protein CEXT_808141 [Caerostris extrusa]|uniref:Uncharacterized protein n=1 Tax=Caerostris extrusa TaxID=172846 RepID=A0AAV4S2V0_CAEEX|nr:hypothetical protein CEXT_808141 [Caerostris extrusa]
MYPTNIPLRLMRGGQCLQTLTVIAPGFTGLMGGGYHVGNDFQQPLLIPYKSFPENPYTLDNFIRPTIFPLNSLTNPNVFPESHWKYFQIACWTQLAPERRIVSFGSADGFFFFLEVNCLLSNTPPSFY